MQLENCRPRGNCCHTGTSSFIYSWLTFITFEPIGGLIRSPNYFEIFAPKQSAYIITDFLEIDPVEINPPAIEIWKCASCRSAGNDSRALFALRFKMHKYLNNRSISSGWSHMGRTSTATTQNQKQKLNKDFFSVRILFIYFLNTSPSLPPSYSWHCLNSLMQRCWIAFELRLKIRAEKRWDHGANENGCLLYTRLRSAGVIGYIHSAAAGESRPHQASAIRTPKVQRINFDFPIL